MTIHYTNWKQKYDEVCEDIHKAELTLKQMMKENEQLLEDNHLLMSILENRQNRIEELKSEIDKYKKEKLVPVTLNKE